MSVVTISLDVRVIDRDLLIDVARDSPHFSAMDIMEAARLIPDDDISAALRAAFYALPPIPGTVILNFKCSMRDVH